MKVIQIKAKNTFTKRSFGTCLRGYALMSVPFKLICTIRIAEKRLATITKTLNVK